MVHSHQSWGPSRLSWQCGLKTAKLRGWPFASVVYFFFILAHRDRMLVFEELSDIFSDHNNHLTSRELLMKVRLLLPWPWKPLTLPPREQNFYLILNLGDLGLRKFKSHSNFLLPPFPPSHPHNWIKTGVQMCRSLISNYSVLAVAWVSGLEIALLSKQLFEWQGPVCNFMSFFF